MKLTALNCHRVFAELAVDITLIKFCAERPLALRRPLTLRHNITVRLADSTGFEDTFAARLINVVDRQSTPKAAGVALSLMAGTRL
jgi:hypothetical protein